MRSAVVVCPGRGTYNKTELGYLARQHKDKAALLAGFDAIRASRGRERLADLDGAESYAVARHTRGDNVSGLIFACSYADFLAIDRNAFDIVAITGNSMGWYTALACAGALSADASFELVDTMGALMQERLIGGQLVYPAVGEDWRDDPVRRAELLALIERIGGVPGDDLALSIDLGGMLVVAGNTPGLEAFEAAVPVVQGRYPMRLANHAAFHTQLQAPVSQQAQALFDAGRFTQPALPLIDGRGAIWWPGAVERTALHAYTLGQQVVETYDFTRAIVTAVRELAPDVLIVLGPGTTMGGAVAQSLIRAGWRGMASRSDFEALQRESPMLISMGVAGQREMALGLT